MITCALSTSASMAASSSLAEEESSSTVEVLIGNMYRSLERITGW